jgi:hypothetical protein
MFVADTNVLIYAADRDSPEHAPCRRLVEAWRAQATPWYLTWGIVYEFLRVTTHPNVFRRPWTPAEAWQFLDALMGAPSVRFLAETERHRAVAAEVFSETPDIAGNLVFDAHTAILMRENGIKTIYTRDADFNRFAFVDTIDPVSGQRRTAAPRRRPRA